MTSALLDRDAHSEFSALLGLIYEGAMHVDAWQSVPQRIAQWLRAPRCTLFTPMHTPAVGGFMTAHNLSPLAMEMWATKYHAHDLWALRARDLGVAVTGRVFRDQDLCTEAEFLATEMYREFFAPMDVGRLLSGVVFGLEDRQHMPVACSCNRPLREPFSSDDAFRLSLLVPHLSCALGVMFRLREADFKLASTLSALDLLHQAVVLFGRRGEVFYANRAAHHIFELKDGLFLAAHGGAPGLARLEVPRPAQQAALDAAIAASLRTDQESATHFSLALTLDRPSGAAPYAVRFSALPEINEFGHGATSPCAIAFIDNGNLNVSGNSELLSARYGLTEAEVRVALCLAEGDSVDAAGELLGISPNTVKTHLKRVYEKTGASSRSQLLKLVLACRLSAPREST